MKQTHQKEQKKQVNGVALGNTGLSIQRRIALRAYELYVQRGGTDGHEVEDWLQAERDVVQEERH